MIVEPVEPAVIRKRTCKRKLPAGYRDDRWHNNIGHMERLVFCAIRADVRGAYSSLQSVTKLPLQHKESEIGTMCFEKPGLPEGL
jgi:hypothetical protein